MFFCDPPGNSTAESLCNHGGDWRQHNYIWFYDQEPIHLDIHHDLFVQVILRNLDLDCDFGPRKALIVTSEHNSQFVNTICEFNGWEPHYYFFHGWAALDWYRGYDRTYLMPNPEDRQITRSFFSANRIIGGKRNHRVLLMHLFQKYQIRNAWISFPAICPAENRSALEIASALGADVAESLSSADLPLCFPGETDHPMHSCYLSLFNENAESLAHVVTETVYYGQRHHLTEKTFKPICLRMPFVMVSTAGSLEYLRDYGFQTFDSIWDEDYDLETDDDIRLEKIATLLKSLDDMSPRELQQMYRAARPMIEHNYKHFYSGTFEQILWTELQRMLLDIKHSIGPT